MADASLLVRVWGARGSTPAPAAGNCAFGSDTCCVEVRCGPHVLIFDAGTGAANLGARLVEEGTTDFDLFLTHCHLDHIIGLPFLKPLYDEAVSARIYAGHFEDATTCRQMVEQFMSPPFFPVTPKHFHAAIEFRDFRPPDTLALNSGIAVRTVRLNHPNGAVGYRVDYQGHSVCYITDTEHVYGKLDEGLVATIRNSDMMIYDASFTDAEFDRFCGYGHSTWEHGVRLCEAAGAKRLMLFHHRPGRDDDDLRRIEKEAQVRFPGSIVGRTGLELTL